MVEAKKKRKTNKVNRRESDLALEVLSQELSPNVHPLEDITPDMALLQIEAYTDMNRLS